VKVLITTIVLVLLALIAYNTTPKDMALRQTEFLYVHIPDLPNLCKGAGCGTNSAFIYVAVTMTETEAEELRRYSHQFALDHDFRRSIPGTDFVTFYSMLHSYKK
jgi:hypothetical protein